MAKLLDAARLRSVGSFSFKTTRKCADRDETPAAREGEMEQWQQLK
jgi:hypothetical protein